MYIRSRFSYPDPRLYRRSRVPDVFVWHGSCCRVDDSRRMYRRYLSHTKSGVCMFRVM